MHWPVARGTSAGSYLTQGFYGDYITYCGARGGCGTHNGYDYGIPVGTPLYGVAPGIVDGIDTTDTWSSEYGTAGRWVRVRHTSATVPGLAQTHYVAYLHMNSISVSVGQLVTTTTVLGYSGNTGGVAAHLHLHVSLSQTYCSNPVDPGCPTPAYVTGSVIPPNFFDAPGCQQVCGAVPILWAQPAAYGNEAWVGSIDPACAANPNYLACNGSSLEQCVNGHVQVTPCTGGTCNPSPSPHCVDTECIGHENSSSCTSTTVMAVCAQGQYSINDCIVFGASCSTLGGPAHCVDYRCKNKENSSTCATSQLLGVCDKGAYTEYNCGAYGASCSTLGGSPHCTDYRCANRENATFCVSLGVLGTCANGAYSDVDCSLIGATCTDSGGAGHCIHYLCTNRENATWCDSTQKLSQCTNGAYAEKDCQATGQTCSEALGTGRCIDPACVGKENLAWCKTTAILSTCSGGLYAETSCAPAGGYCSDSGGSHCIDFRCAKRENESWCQGALRASCTLGAYTEEACDANGGNCAVLSGVAVCTQPECAGKGGTSWCEGTVKKSCVSGVLASEDCTSTNQSCKDGECTGSAPNVLTGPNSTVADGGNAEATSRAASKTGCGCAHSGESPLWFAAALLALGRALRARTQRTAR